MGDDLATAERLVAEMGIPDDAKDELDENFARGVVDIFEVQFAEKMASLDHAASESRLEGEAIDDVQAAVLIQRMERGKLARRSFERKRNKLKEYARNLYICSQLRVLTPEGNIPTQSPKSVDRRAPRAPTVPRFSVDQLQRNCFFMDDGGINWECSATLSLRNYLS